MTSFSEKELDGDQQVNQIVVEILGAEEKSISRNGEIEIEAMQKQDPKGLRSRKKMASFSRSFSNPITPTKPTMVSPRAEDDDDDDNDDGVSDDKDGVNNDNDEIYAKVNHRRRKRTTKTKLLEVSLLVCLTVILILSNTMHNLKKIEIWRLKLWKWCILVLAFFCGRLLSECLTNPVLFLIQRNYFLRNKVRYFVNGLEKSVINIIWLVLILLAWGLLINRGVHRSRSTAKVLNHITRGIAAILVVHGVWILKVLLVKNMYSYFHVNLFFDRIQDNIVYQYILHSLSGPPLTGDSKSSSKEGGEKKKKNAIDMQTIRQLERRTVSAWTMTDLMNIITGSDLSVLENDTEREGEKFESITNELKAENAGRVMFKNVAKHNHKYIEEDDLLSFMKKEEVNLALILFEGADDTGKISKKSLINWVVDAYRERRRLALSIQDMNAVVNELDKFITGLTVVVLMILWLIISGIASTEVLLFISSQFLLAVFSFGATAKSSLDAVIFVFVIHPFDVGDRCVVDGVQVLVEEVNILTTVFLTDENEKIYYPNSLLATKPISNLYRSPDMSDYVDFDLDASTSDDKILALKAEIKTYIESKPNLWRAEHDYIVKEVEDLNKMKMSMFISHTMNFQKFREISRRRTILMLKLKNIFEELGIKYHLLPIRSSISATTATSLVS